MTIQVFYDHGRNSRKYIRFKRNIKMSPFTNNLFNILVYYLSVLFSWELECTCTYTGINFKYQFPLNA